MEQILFEEEIFSSEESTQLPEDWSFITQAPQPSINFENESTGITLTIWYNGILKETKLFPSVVTNTYTINQLKINMVKLFGEPSKAFTFKLPNGKIIENDNDLQQTLISQMEETLTIFASEKVEHSCFLCMSTCCKHVKRSNYKVSKNSTKKTRKRKSRNTTAITDYEHNLTIPQSPQSSQSLCQRANKRARQFKVVPESDDLSSDISDDVVAFSIVNPSAVYQFN